MSNWSPKSVFTGKGANGEKITMFEWDYATWLGFETINNVIVLLVALVFSAFVPLILLFMAIANYSGRHKGLYVIGILSSGYFLYDCSHGWIVLTAINLFFSEPTINILVSLNVVAIVLFTVFLFIGGMLYDTIEYNINEVTNRWVAFIMIVAVVGGITFFTALSGQSNHKGWVDKNITTESESAKKERLEREKQEEIGEFGSKEERDKHFEELEKRWGNH